MGKISKKLFFLVALLVVLLFGLANFSHAETLDYQGQLIIDSDLDGLTDLGEEQIYKTDKNNPDTDSDGFFDGVEVARETDPNDVGDLQAKALVTTNSSFQESETPWAWYVSRASGLIGFALLYVVFVFALVLRIPGISKYFASINALQIHCTLSLQALLFAFIHGFALMFDKFIKFSFADAFVPFASDFKPELVTLGILSFYIMVLLIVSSYAQKWISHKLWRVVHYSNIVLFVINVIHALYLGTDLKSGIPRMIFIYANTFLALLILINIFFRIQTSIMLRSARKRASVSFEEPQIKVSAISSGIPRRTDKKNENDENIRPGGPKIV